MPKKFASGVAVIAIAISLAAIAIAPSVAKVGPQTRPNLKARLAACGSLPIGSTTHVVNTTRMFINLPKDIYPKIKLQITPRGAMAIYVSNAGRYGYAFDARGRPNCWSTYFEFELTADNQRQTGTVDIGSKSGIKGLPNYLIHIQVMANPADVIPPSAANVHGQVLLGPTCPVERIPPDPACAPKPYVTTVDVFTARDTAHPYRTQRTNVSGAFNFILGPGAYVLRAQSGSPYPRCTDLPIEVTAGVPQRVILNCDTGIR